MSEHKDFAKIVLASNGQQVLFYKSVEDGEVNTLNCIADFGGYQANMKISGIPDKAFEALIMEKCDVAMADKVVAQAAGF